MSGAVGVVMTPSRPVSIDDQVAAAKREVVQRVRVYARLVARGSMTQAKADQELDRMRAIVVTLEAVADYQRRAIEFLALCEKAEDDNLVGDEGCIWPIEDLRFSLAGLRSALGERPGDLFK